MNEGDVSDSNHISTKQHNSADDVNENKDSSKSLVNDEIVESAWVPDLTLSSGRDSTFSMLRARLPFMFRNLGGGCNCGSC